MARRVISPVAMARPAASMMTPLATCRMRPSRPSRRARAIAAMPQVRLTLLIGGHAQRWVLGPGPVGAAVARWREAPAGVLPLPHPSWRNTAWLRRHPWFEAELVPELRRRVAALLA